MQSSISTAYVFHGGPVRFPREITSSNANWSISITNPPLSGSVACIDVNADGIDDIIIGGLNKAQGFYGSASGLPADHRPDFVISESPILTNNVGTDGLKYSITGGFEVVARDGNLCDATSPQIPCGSQFVIGVPGTAIDLNKNGFVDQNERYCGIALVGPRWQFLNGDKAPYTEFGYQLGHAGDINGDGETDLIISSRDQYHVGKSNKVFVYLGTSAGFAKMETNYAWAVEAPIGGRFFSFGAAVGSAGDINGDGYGDIFISDPRYDNIGNRAQTNAGSWGRAFIFFGGPRTPSDPSGLGLYPTPTSADIMLQGDSVSGEFGFAFAAGDINGDGVSDLVIGDPRSSANCRDNAGQLKFAESGEVWVYLADVDLDHDGRTGVTGGDCNDRDPTIYPGAPELPDGKDNDCDGLIDEPCPGPRLTIRRDGSGGYIIRTPGLCTYRLQRATDLRGPWTTLGTISAAAEYHDTAARAFYRTVQP